MRPDPDKVFDTREEAERVRDHLNHAPPEYGYGRWYLGGPVEGKWWVIRWRGLMAEETGDAKAYEEAHRQAFERIAMAHDFWREVEGIRFDAVQIDGEFPDTKLVLLFRSVPEERFGVADPNCLFGVRWPIWPAADPDPVGEASELETSFNGIPRHRPSRLPRSAWPMRPRHDQLAGLRLWTQIDASLLS